jgi:hypothetical protein
MKRVRVDRGNGDTFNGLALWHRKDGCLKVWVERKKTSFWIHESLLQFPDPPEDQLHQVFRVWRDAWFSSSDMIRGRAEKGIAGEIAMFPGYFTRLSLTAEDRGMRDLMFHGSQLTPGGAIYKVRFLRPGEARVSRDPTCMFASRSLSGGEVEAIRGLFLEWLVRPIHG